MPKEGDFATSTTPEGQKELFIVKRVLDGQVTLVRVSDPDVEVNIFYTEGAWHNPEYKELKYEFYDTITSMFLNIREADILRLSKFSEESLDYLCLNDPYVGELCKDDFLWKLWIETWFPDFLNDREPGETWKDYASVLPTFVSYNGRLIKIPLIEHERIKLLEKVKEELTIEDANRAVEEGRLRVLDWMAQNELYFPDETGLYPALMDCRVEIMEWTRQQKLPSPNLSDLITAAEKGCTNILEWAIEKGFYQGKGLEIANWVAQKGKLTILKWMEEKRLPLPNGIGARHATEKGKSEVVAWLAQRAVFPDDTPEVEEEEIKDIMEEMELDYIKSLDFPMPSYAVSYACEFHRADVLDWLNERYGYVPYSSDLDYAIEDDSLFEGGLTLVDFLDWVYQRFGTLPSRMGADDTAALGHMRALEWLESRKVLPTKTGADMAARKHLEVIKWLFVRGIFPGKKGIEDAISNGQFEILEFLRERGKYQPKRKI